MKAIIAIVLTTLFAQVSLAQIEKGTIRLGPTFEFLAYSDMDLDYKSSDMILGFNASYFVIEGLGVGVEFLNQFRKAEQNDRKATSNTIGIGPHAMYMVRLSEQFYIPIYVRFLFTSNKSEEPFFGKRKNTGNIFIYGTGIEYLVGNKLGLRLNVGQEIFSVRFEDPSVTRFGTHIRSSLGIGIYF